MLTSTNLNNIPHPSHVETAQVDTKIPPSIFSVLILIYSEIPQIYNQNILSKAYMQTYNEVPCLPVNITGLAVC